MSGDDHAADHDPFGKDHGLLHDPSEEDLTGPLVARLRAAGCVFAEEEAALLLAEASGTLDTAEGRAELERRTARRVAGEPLEQVLGWAAFAGLRVAVAPGVFVPRRRSELLVREGLALVLGLAARDDGDDDDGDTAVVVDLCCGTGALGLAVAAGAAAAGRTVELHAADVDPAATACAARNLAGLATGSAQVSTGDLFDALPDRLRGLVDVLLVNAPYVPAAQVALMPPEARDHEPLVALDGGADGLDVHRRVAAGARSWLSARGGLILETSRRQAAGTAAACSAGGLHPVVVTDEDLEATAVLARP